MVSRALILTSLFLWTLAGCTTPDSAPPATQDVPSDPAPPAVWTVPFSGSGGWVAGAQTVGGTSVAGLYEESSIEHTMATNESLIGFDLSLEWDVLDPTAEVTWILWCKMPDANRACSGQHPLVEVTGASSPLTAVVDGFRLPAGAVLVQDVKLAGTSPWRDDTDPLSPDFEIDGSLTIQEA